jgi:predicted alpha-1,2-mannosidase
VVATCLLALGSVPAGAAAHRTPTPSGKSDPAADVDPFIGTGVGGTQNGAINTFPGADLPFGMLQWSPETVNTGSGQVVSSGYLYSSSTISGFSLTHISGAGCQAFGDIPFMPYSGTVTASPAASPSTYDTGFSHRDESASPGYYHVTLADGVQVSLTVTDRTGIGRFVFPPGTTPSILVSPGGSQMGDSAEQVSAAGGDGFEGSATSGHFCASPDSYNVYFDARFQSRFASVGTWSPGGIEPGSTSTSGLHSGMYATFPSARSRPTVVTMKVGISFVSPAGARSNLAVEQHGWNFDGVRRSATRTWNGYLAKIAVSGGTRSQHAVFYTALYHSLLFPSVFSDDDRKYVGLDGHVHVAGRYPQYTNMSEWDIYQCEVPLLALVAPTELNGVVTSLLRDDQQDGGWLPRWEYADDNVNLMGGDSADPIIAGAYAFGARGFDARQALADMERGADVPGTAGSPGSDGYVERPGLAGYLADGYVPYGTTTVSGETSSVTPDSASVTLEYAVDDFAISRLATALGKRSTASRFLRRSANWKNIYDPTTGWDAPKTAGGTYPLDWPTGSTTLSQNLLNDGLGGVGQVGFQEGDSQQYTWMVPQDLAGLFRTLGGTGPATHKLRLFFSQLNAGSTAPYDWAGNEQCLEIPWEADYSGAPWLTDQAVNRIVTQLYPDSPDGGPGNDDLGAMSSWAVWAMLGLYPETPGTSVLVMGSPTFPRATFHLPHMHAITVTARRAAPGDEFVSAAHVDGKPTQHPWLDGSVVSRGATLSVTLIAQASPTWGTTAAADAPPSYPPPS